MSREIDEKVVSMQFDNRHFERNVSTTMSTLDKLKQKLNFKESGKGLENIGSAVKKVDMGGLGNAVDTVRAKFSALDVIGVTALANITNQAVNAGKRMVSALTIDPIKSGFQEYETQMNAVQTILANTQSKGSTLDDVNNALDLLNQYADKTIYNFTEMTRNIGTFTAAGVDLQTSVDSIQGIANLAAVSGSSSQQASTAMYQLSQALAAGRVSLMDWNSVVNAGMGGELFQNALIRTSELLKTGAKDAIATYGSFRESLTQGEWLTTEVLTETLKQLSGAYTEADLIAQGFTEQQAKEITDLAKTATDAATKVKTFSQLWDVMKESAQSGWAQTWKLIVGDFEQAKALLTPLADFFTGVINSISEARNKLLESALGKGFSKLADNIKNLTKPAAKAVETIKETVETVTDLGKIVDEVILGKFGNGADRYNALTEAGINYYEVQNKVNEKLGDSFRHTDKQIEAQNRLLGIQSKTNESKIETTESQEKLTEAENKQIATLARMSEAELKSLGYTKEQIEAFKELSSTADKLGLSVEDFLANIDEIDGRWLLINSFKNAGQGLVAIFKAIGDAWRDAFPPMQADTLFNIIAGLHKFSTNLIVSGGTAEKLTRTLKGLFAILDLVATVTGGVFRAAFDIVSTILKVFDTDILGVTASIGDAIVAFRDWVEEHNIVLKAFELLAYGLKEGIEAIRSWIDSLKDSKNLPKDIAEGIVNGFASIPKHLSTIFKRIREYITNAFSGLKTGNLDGFLGSFIKDLKIAGQTIKELGKILLENLNSFLSAHGFETISEDMISGLVNGLKANAVKVWDAIVELATNIINKIKGVLGIHSPSTEFQEVGKNLIDGLVLGLQNGAKAVWNAITAVITPAVDWVKSIDFGAIFAVGISAGIVYFVKTISDAFSAIASPLEGLGDMMSGAGKVMDKAAKPIAKTIKSFAKVMNSVAFSIKVDAIKKLVNSLVLLVGAIVVLTFIDPKKLWNAVGVVAALAGVIIALSIVTEKMSQASASVGKDGVKMEGFKTGLLGIAAAMLLLAIVVKLIGSMNPDEAQQGFLGLAGMVIALGALLAVYGQFVKGKAAQNIDKAGDTIKKIGVAMLLLAITAKLISGMSWGEMGKAGVGLAGLALVIAGLIAATKLAGKKLDKVGPMILQISAAMLLLTIVAKLISGMSWGEMGKAGVGLLGLTAVVAALIYIVKLAGTDVDKIGTTILSLSVAMGALVLVGKIIAGMSWGEMGKAAIGLAGLSGVIALLVNIVKSVGNDAPKIAATLLAMSVSMGILAAVAIVLGLIKIEHLAKGIVAMGLLAGIMTMLVKSTRGATDCKDNLIAMSVAIGVMAGAIAVLSFIKTDKLIVATGALALLMGMFALIEKAGSNINGSLGTLIVMTVAIGVMAGVIYLLAQLPIESTIASALSLSVLMLAMSAVLKIVSGIGKTAINALIGVGLLTAMAVPMLAFIGVLALMSMVKNATENAMALTVMMTVMAGLMIPLTVIGALWPAAAAGLICLTALAVPMLLFVGVIALMCMIEGATANIDLLMSMMDSLVAMLGQLAIIGPMALIGVAAMAGLTALMVAIGAFAIAIGALMSICPELEDFLNTGLPILEQLAGSIGTMIGNFVAGFSTAIAESLPNIANQLSLFMIQLQPFITLAKLIDEKVLAGVGILAAAIIALTVADLINGVATFLSGGESFASLGTQLSMFMVNALPFFIGAASIKPETMEGIKSLAEAILILTAADILDGLTSWFTGGSSLANFGAELALFGPYLATFAESVKGINSETVTAAANAGKTLAEMASALPNSGGVMGFFAGENDMATFGAQLEAFGKSIARFSKAVAGKIDEEAVTAAANAGKLMAEMADTLPNSGGVLGFFAGENDMDTFGVQLEAFGKSLAKFSKAVAGKINEEAITAAANAGTMMSDLANEIPNFGGVVSWFTGDNDLKTFGTQIVAFGDAMKNYSDSVSGLEIEPINASIEAAKALSKIEGTLGNSGGMASWFSGDNDIGTFGSNIRKFGEAMKSYSDEVSGINTAQLHSSTSQFKKVAEMVKSLGGIDFDNLSSFGKSLGKVGKDGVNKFIKAFTDADSKVKKAGQKMLTSLVKGVESKTNTLSKKFKRVVSEAVEAIRDKYDSFYKAGSYLVSGFVNGIGENSYKAKAKASAMAEAAKLAAEAALGINSPSKVFYKIGAYTGEGFIKGLGDYTSKVYSASTDMATSARSGFSEAISRINDALDGNMDVQPTIRPVLDLSDVRTGAGAISNLLSNRASVGVLANVGSINTSMNRRSQNGTNSDVVSAITKLRKEMREYDRTVNNINGVTYDDGSNLTDAVRTIVRVAKVERRK